MDDAFKQARATFFETQIVAYEAAVAALAGGSESYTINTGQTSQTVKKAGLESVRKTLEWLYSQYDFWSSQLSTEPTSTIVRPFI